MPLNNVDLIHLLWGKPNSQNYFRVIPYLTDQETMFSLEFWTFFEIYLTQIAYVRRQTIID